MRDLSKVLSITAILGTMAIFGFSPGPKVDLAQPVGVFEAAKLDSPTDYVAHGSGVFISPTHFLTAAHVIDMFNKKTTAHIRMEDGNIYNIVEVHKADNVDAGYVVIDRPYKGFIPKVSCEAQGVGTELLNVGNPLGLEFIETHMNVTGGRPRLDVEQNSGLNPPPPVDTSPLQRHMPLEQKPDTPKANLNGTVFFQGPALPGQSGSPVFTKSGDVIGVIAITIVDPTSNSYTGLGLYVSTNSMCDFVTKAAK